MITIATIIAIAVCFALYGAYARLRKAFSDQSWISLEEDNEENRRARLELDNTEYDWGHNVNHNSE